MSVIVKFDEWGRMGNRMFQYAFGYLLANDRQDHFYTEGLPNFNISRTNNHEIDYRSNGTQVVFTRSMGNNYVDYAQVKNKDLIKNVIIDSFVQKSEYYINFREELRNIFNIQKKESINKNTLVVHIRETDYIQINAFLGYNFYKKAIETTGFKDIIIVTDNSNCETVKRLISEGCSLHSEGYVAKFSPICDERAMFDFYSLLYSENVLISQSSFSWWAAFLGDHKNIFIPYSEKGGMWKPRPEKDDVDLWFNYGNTKRIEI